MYDEHTTNGANQTNSKLEPSDPAAETNTMEDKERYNIEENNIEESRELLSKSVVVKTNGENIFLVLENFCERALFFLPPCMG